MECCGTRVIETRLVCLNVSIDNDGKDLTTALLRVIVMTKSLAEEYFMCYQKVDDVIRLVKLALISGYSKQTSPPPSKSSQSILISGICAEFSGKENFTLPYVSRCRSSPKVFDTLSEALCWVLQNKLMVYLLDDFLTATPPSGFPAICQDIIKKVFKK